MNKPADFPGMPASGHPDNDGIVITPASGSFQGARQLVLDTETTGFEVRQGDRLIEIGLVEVVGRKLTGATWHAYINPQRPVGESERIHGISDEFLQDKPLFARIVDSLLSFIGSTELIAHNSSFDLGFLDTQLGELGHPALSACCPVTDTLQLAKRLYPGQKNTLDALVKRVPVAKRDRTYHGALLDAQILADVYLAMTGGQVKLDIQGQGGQSQQAHRRITGRQPRFGKLDAAGQAAHDAYLADMKQPVWLAGNAADR